MSYPVKSQGQLAEEAGGNPGAYLLITSELLAGSFQPLLDRRISQDFSGELITVEAINLVYTGADVQEKIRQCVKDHYDPSIPLFVALGGDESVIPVRYCLGTDPGVSIAVDFYYADVDGGTWDLDGNGVYGESGDMLAESTVPEAYLGRIPVRSPAEVSTYIAKVVTYENAHPENFSHSMIYIGGMQAFLSGDKRPPDFRHHDPVCATEIRLVRDYLDYVQPYWQPTPLHLMFWTLTSWDKAYCGDYGVNADNLIYRISQGYHFVVYNGHAGYNHWSLDGGVQFDWEHAGRLLNPIPFILWSGGCSAGNFDWQPDPTLSEAFIRNPHGGAVAVFGHNRPASNSPNRPALWSRVFQHRDTYLGQAFANALADVPTGQFLFTFLGDPAIKPLLDDEPGRKIQIFSPNGCEVMDTLLDDIVIRWNAQGTGFRPDDLVKLEYSADSGASWSPIPGAEALPYNGRAFVWEAGSSISCGASYRIRVSLLADPSVKSQSRTNFTITRLGLLTVESIPYLVSVAGTHPGETNYTFSAVIGGRVVLTAPYDADGCRFTCWADALGGTLSTEPTYEFVFPDDTTVVAKYTRTHYYVNDEIPEPNYAAGDDLNDGFTAQTPKRHITSMLEAYPDMASYVVIHVSEGTYQEQIVLTNANNGLTLLGAGAESTVIDAQSSRRCVLLEGCENCTIKGLSLKNGSARDGGGISCEFSSLYAEDCEFADNIASIGGGGLYVFHSTVTLTRCVVHRNSALRGGGISNIAGDAILQNCLLVSNFAQRQGGGIYSRDGNSSLTNCTLSRNAIGGGAVLGSAVFHKGGGIPTLVNCIVWDNVGVGIEGPIATAYSNLQGGLGSMLVDPLFADPDNGDFHLKSQDGRYDPATQTWILDEVTSLCIDAGDPNSPLGDEPEPNGGRINMGAYGGTCDASKSP